MSQTNQRDVVVGLFVLGALLALGYLSFSVAGVGHGPAGGMQLRAAFDELGGLKERAPVRISGVRVGEVERIDLADDYRAEVVLDVGVGLELPVDTSASIMTAGLLGDRYVSLQLGGEIDLLADGDEIGFTESAVVLERMIGKLVHNVGIDNEEDE